MRSNFLTTCTNSYTRKKVASRSQLYADPKGRSMVEMLGVLAIVGVLSVGAIAGYSKAMMKYRLNKFSEASSMLINNFLQLKGQLSYAPNTQTCYGTLFKKMNLLPDGINYIADCAVTDQWFKSRITLYYANDKYEGGQNNFGGILFSFYPSSQGKEICRSIIFAAKENSANLHNVNLAGTNNMNNVYYGDQACGKNIKCLHSITITEAEKVCEDCNEVSCRIGAFYK